VILPNVLTVSRLILTLFFIFFITRDGFTPKLFGAVIFCIASITDFYDGYYAKKHDLITDFGKVMDPIADKFLVLAAFLIFTQMQVIALWMFLIIFAREVIITSVRLMAMRKGQVLAAEQMGKFKTVSQMAAIMVILVFVVVRELQSAMVWSEEVIMRWEFTIHSMMSIAVLLTVASGLSYLWNNRRLLDD